MLEMDKVLFDLLVRHNCVIIPDFGGFIAKRIPSAIDYDKGTIIPPSKHLLFNKFLTTDDGLLISSFVKYHNKKYEEVKSELRDYISGLNDRLNKGEELVFKGIGSLSLSEQGNYTFKQDRTSNLLADAYGLKELEFVSARVEEVVEEVKEDKTEEVENEVRLPVSRGRSLVWKYAAAACLLPLICYSLWVPIKSDFFNSGMISIDDFNPFYTKEEGTYRPNMKDPKVVKQEEVDSKTEKESLLENVVEDKVEVPIVDIVEVPAEAAEDHHTVINEVQPVPRKQPTFDTYFIVGCFSVKENADKYLSRLLSDGFNPVLVDGGRLHRVAVGQASNEEEFNALVTKAKEQGYKGWTLKK